MSSDARAADWASRLDLNGDHRKPTPELARPCCLDRSVQGKKVGLEGDVVDQVDDVGDLCREVDDAIHRGGRRDHDAAAVLGGAHHGCCELAGLARSLGILAHGLGKVLYGR